MSTRCGGTGCELPKKQTVTFIHPDLGIGGAERLIVDAAVGLKEKGYNVYIITGYHNPLRAFPETIDGTLKVISVGQWLPRNMFGKFHALCAYFKMIYAALYLTLFAGIKSDFIVCDQISACIPFLRLRWIPWSRRPPVLFYCHFPDQLLTQRLTFWKTLYRYVIDWLEQFTTNLADKIVVNSRFTREVFQRTFKSIETVPDVLYPSINSGLFDGLRGTKLPAELNIPTCQYLLLSINRFERKKNIELAILAMKKLKMCLEGIEWDNVHLVLAGGYDERLEENVEYFNELKNMVQNEKLQEKITFVASPSDQVKVALLECCITLIYTPTNEHFGIVPLEAMYMGKPVIAVNSGGPTETILSETTGLLCPPISTHFGVAMARLIKDPIVASKFGAAGKERFLEMFSFAAFSNEWKLVLESFQDMKKIQ